jgi:hypothetical protein
MKGNSGDWGGLAFGNTDHTVTAPAGAL